MLQEITNTLEPINSFILANAPIICVIFAFFAILTLYFMVDALCDIACSNYVKEIRNILDRIASELKKMSDEKQSEE